jgi:hypothetical protein
MVSLLSGMMQNKKASTPPETRQSPTNNILPHLLKMTIANSNTQNNQQFPRSPPLLRMNNAINNNENDNSANSLKSEQLVNLARTNNPLFLLEQKKDAQNCQNLI